MTFTTEQAIRTNIGTVRLGDVYAPADGEAMTAVRVAGDGPLNRGSKAVKFQGPTRNTWVIGRRVRLG